MAAAWQVSYIAKCNDVLYIYINRVNASSWHSKYTFVIIFLELEFGKSYGHICNFPNTSIFMTSSEPEAKHQCREDPNCHHFYFAVADGGYFKCKGDYQIADSYYSFPFYSKRIKYKRKFYNSSI